MFENLKAKFKKKDKKCECCAECEDKENKGSSN
jgi:hypothetical protein